MLSERLLWTLCRHNDYWLLVRTDPMPTVTFRGREIDGPAGDRTAVERRRLAFPPHDPDSGLRLACQTRVRGDLTVTKHQGFWGQHVEE